MKEFKGKTALITGAAYGFGKEFVKQAAKRGMKIVAVDIILVHLAHGTEHVCCGFVSIVAQGPFLDLYAGEQEQRFL